MSAIVIAMEMYSVERWILDRHDEATRGADERSRLDGWPVKERMSHRVAAVLRRLADRLDGRHWAPNVVGSSPRAESARGEGSRIFLHPG